MYVNELKRSGGLAGFSGGELDRLVRLNFVNGCPDSITCDLQQINGVSDLISRARVLTANKAGAGMISAAVADEGRPPVGIRSTKINQQNSQWHCEFRDSCCRCGGPHMAKFCNNRVEREIVCYPCSESF